MAGLHITKAQDGKVVRASVGDVVVLELPENPATGYKWAFALLDESRLAVESAEYMAAVPRSAAAASRGGHSRPARPARPGSK